MVYWIHSCVGYAEHKIFEKKNCGINLYFDVLFFQKSTEMIQQGITGPEAHEMCRPEEVGVKYTIVFNIFY